MRRGVACICACSLQLFRTLRHPTSTFDKFMECSVRSTLCGDVHITETAYKQRYSHVHISACVHPLHMSVSIKLYDLVQAFRSPEPGISTTSACSIRTCPLRNLPTGSAFQRRSSSFIFHLYSMRGVHPWQDGLPVAKGRYVARRTHDRVPGPLIKASV